MLWVRGKKKEGDGGEGVCKSAVETGAGKENKYIKQIKYTHKK